MEKALAAEATFFWGEGCGGLVTLQNFASTRIEIPFFSVPTAASHDGIASSRASMIDNGHNATVQAQPLLP
jgi:glycerol-1-phosphate dehydrogenase [NAD(P)+]